MSLDIDAVVDSMVKAATKPLVSYGKQACTFAASEFRNIAELIAGIGMARETEKITPEDAQDMLEQAKLDSKSAMDTEAGIGAVAAEEALDAALAAVSGIVNGYLGFQLI